MKKLWALIVLIASAILSGALVFNILKKAGLDEAFNFDLDPDEEEFYEYI
jgi:hypothetical protein